MKVELSIPPWPCRWWIWHKFLRYDYPECPVYHVFIRSPHCSGTIRLVMN